MAKLTGTLSKLQKRKILVVGDIMLDAYTIGKARRISPEAPVAVVSVLREENRAGGAANVALNLISLGSDVVLVGRVGDDQIGGTLIDVLKAENIALTGVFEQKNYKTPLKNRVIADGQQIVRIDHEEISQIPEMLEDTIIEALPALFQGVDAVAISDYGKGFLSKTLLSAVIDKSKELKIPVITDPKGIDFAKYSGSTIIKPNLSEAFAAAQLLPDASLELVASRILPICGADMLMVTRSESGISIFHKDGRREDHLARVREVKDVTGAGDTVLAMLTLSLANNLPVGIAAELCNVAAGIAIERFGCTRIDIADLAERLLENDVTNKVFDDQHLFALEKVLQSKEYTLLGLSGKNSMTPTIFKAIHQLGSKGHFPLVVYLMDDYGSTDGGFIDLLTSLHDVKFIINSNNFGKMCEQVPPKKVFAVKEEPGTGTYALQNEKLSELSCFKELF
jgi:D-beta-D-heptose 7-phosphate kinase/D-beta-D-heptose 1-phosphate adenosyltransferase